MATVQAVSRHTFWDLEASPLCCRPRTMSDSVVSGILTASAISDHAYRGSQRHAKWSDDCDEAWDCSTESGSSLSDGKPLATRSDSDLSDDLPLPSLPPGAHVPGCPLHAILPPGVHVAPKQEAKTTLKLLNFPGHMSRDDVVDWLSQHGFRAGLHYDFLHTQTGLDRKSDVGQTLINLCTPVLAEAMLRQLQGFQDWPCGNVLEVLWNNEQGQARLVERFRNSRVMHLSVADIRRPALFSCDGLRVNFPKPTRRVRQPLTGH